MGMMSATILVVEDDEDNAEIVRSVLVQAGYLVPELARSADEAIVAATRVKPALVLMDIQIAGTLDGIETARILRERLGLRVIYLTGLADDATLRRAKGTSPLGYLKKPFNVRELQIAVELALHHQSDITERRDLERRVAMSERLAAIGTMAAGVQHEINNPLASVVANVQFALDVVRARSDGSPPSPEEQAELVSALEDAAQGAERVRRTVEELRHFSRGPASIDVPIPITRAIDEAIRVSANAVRHNATVHCTYGEAPLVRAEEGQLARVFVNILLFCARTMHDGRAEEQTITITTSTEDGHAVAEVRHDGREIAPDALHRIFEPFYATSVADAANGLELAVCHSILTSLGGDIDVTSEAGSGTAFRVRLPAATAAPTAALEAVPKPSAPAPAAGGGHQAPTPSPRARVLVIDDEVAIGKAIRRILKTEHDVTLEADPRAALELLERETFDVVFCDLMMPNMSGMDFFDELATRAPQVAGRVVFVTGGAFTERSEDFLEKIPNTCISKPFSREDVSTAVRRMLDSR